MKIQIKILFLSLLLPNLSFAAIDFSEVARSVQPNKREFFSELAKIPPSSARERRNIREALARDVLCKIESAYAEQKCKEVIETTGRTLRSYVAEKENIQVVLKALAGLLRGAKLDLTPSGVRTADSLLVNIGTLLAQDRLNEEDMDFLLGAIEDAPTLWEEFQRSPLKVYLDFLSELKYWLKEKGAHSLPAAMGGREVVFCFIKDGSLKCAGNNGRGMLNVPALKNPVSVAIGSYDVCAIDDDGVKCWGQGSMGKIPSLRNPQYVHLLYRLYGEFCAFDDDGLGCWKNDKKEKFMEGTFHDVTDMALDIDSKCVIDAGHLKCIYETQRGGYKRNVLNIGGLKNPRKLTLSHSDAVDGETACLVDDDSARCWNTYTNAVFEYPKVDEPRAIVGDCVLGRREFKCLSEQSSKFWDAIKFADLRDFLYHGQYCANDGGNFRCSRDLEFLLQAPKNIQNGKFVDAKNGCVLDGKDLKCWMQEKIDWMSIFAKLKLSDVKTYYLNEYRSSIIASDGTHTRKVNSHNDKVEYFPDLVSAYEFAKSDYALDKEGLKEFRENKWQRVALPLKNPRSLTTWGNILCLIDDDGLKCWKLRGGTLPWDPIVPPPELKIEKATLVDIENADGRICVLDAQGVRCWIPGEGLSVDLKKTFRNPKKMKILSRVPYVLDEDGLHQYKASPIKNILDFDVYNGGLERICALDNEGMRCWYQ